MPFARVIFNKQGKYHWYDDDDDLIVSLKTNDLNKEWFVADLFFPENPDYNAAIHKQEISGLLSNPDELVRFDISDDVKSKILEFRRSI